MEAPDYSLKCWIGGKPVELAKMPTFTWKNRETGEIADEAKAQIFDRAAQRWRKDVIVVPVVDPLPVVPEPYYSESAVIREEVWERCEAGD